MGRGRRFDDAACSVWLVRVADGGRMKPALAMALIERASGCECGCGLAFGTPLEANRTFDHFFGKARAAEELDTIWSLRRDCHLAKTDNRPSAEEWLKRFLVHAEKFGYRASYEKALRKLSWHQTRDGFEVGK